MKQKAVLNSKEILRLYDLGFALHYLHPNTKIPIGNWKSGEKLEWNTLVRDFNPTNNLGVRLGTPSKIGENYLAVIDVDVKSLNPRHREEAMHAVNELLGDADLGMPTVESGRGNGSCHFYCVTKKPFKTFNFAASSETVKFHSPSKTRLSKTEREKLTDVEIEKGIRLSLAWEISLYSDGRQVVLPPSLHPDSGNPYRWTHPIVDRSSFPLFEPKTPSTGASQTKKPGEIPIQTPKETIDDFEITSVVLDWLDVPKSISLLIQKGLWKGQIVSNRSDYLLVATTGLLSAGCSRDDILTILTEPDYCLGEVAYEHAQTKNRSRAVKWLWTYTVKKVMEERNCRDAFLNTAVETAKTLSGDETKKQQEEIEADTPFTQRLELSKQGKVLPTFQNCLMTLIHECGSDAFVGRNEFAANDFYLVGSPWRSKKGDAVIDADIYRIKAYCSKKYQVEFQDNVINQVLMEIADKNRFHPVREWLTSLVWDGIPRIDTWLKDHAGAVGPAEYLREISRKVLCALVGRVFAPGSKFDYVLILEGVQGAGKSTMLRNLIGDAWFSDATLNIGDKDAVLTMQSKWLIELGELSSMRKAETEQLKAFITQTTDRIRAPYGKRVEEFPRQCIFVGSTNNEEYLPDLTGNRRFWPVKITAIEFGSILKVREQLFAEAVQAYHWGEELWLDDKAVADLAVIEQAKRQFTDEWLSTVEEILEEDDFPKIFEIRNVAEKMTMIGAHKMGNWEIQRIARCLHQIGCESFRESTGSRKRMWSRKSDLIGVQGRPRPSKGPLDDTNFVESSENIDFY